MANESEKLLERKLTKAVKDIGGWGIKLLSVHISGLPDRMCLLPGGRMFFVEVKTTKRKPRKIQRVIHEKLRKLGFKVYIIDTTEKLDNMINRYEF